MAGTVAGKTIPVSSTVLPAAHHCTFGPTPAIPKELAAAAIWLTYNKVF